MSNLWYMPCGIFPTRGALRTVHPCKITGHAGRTAACTYYVGSKNWALRCTSACSKKTLSRAWRLKYTSTALKKVDSTHHFSEWAFESNGRCSFVLRVAVEVGKTLRLYQERKRWGDFSFLEKDVRFLPFLFKRTSSWKEWAFGIVQRLKLKAESKLVTHHFLQD